MSASKDRSESHKRLRGDPAENDWFLRFAYRNWRPTLFGRVLSGAYAWTTSLGLTSPLLITLQTQNDDDGSLISTVLVGADYDGGRFIVSMLGNESR